MPHRRLFLLFAATLLLVKVKATSQGVSLQPLLTIPGATVAGVLPYARGQTPSFNFSPNLPHTAVSDALVLQLPKSKKTGWNVESAFLLAQMRIFLYGHPVPKLDAAMIDMSLHNRCVSELGKMVSLAADAHAAGLKPKTTMPYMSFVHVLLERARAMCPADGVALNHASAQPIVTMLMIAASYLDTLNTHKASSSRFDVHARVYLDLMLSFQATDILAYESWLTAIAQDPIIAERRFYVNQNNTMLLQFLSRLLAIYRLSHDFNPKSIATSLYQYFSIQA